MDVLRFVAGIHVLGYSISTGERLLGVPRRTLYRIASGDKPVPVAAAKLLDMYERYGIPEEHKL